ncbi:MAG: hypothetical protein V3V45_01195 [Candidatus Brocadiales bacterium]
MKKALCLVLILLFIAAQATSCRKRPEEETVVALREEEEEFFKEEIPPLDEWAEQEWDGRKLEEEEPIELKTTGGLKEAMAATSRAMRRLSRSIKKEDWEETKASGKEVEDLIAGRCITLYYRQHTSGVPTEFIIVGDRFRVAIHSLIMAARGRNTRDVQREFTVVRGTCKACHKLFKEKDEEE